MRRPARGDSVDWFGRVAVSAHALRYPASVTWFGRVVVSAHVLIGCGLSCGQAPLRSGPSPGRPELGRRDGGLKHAGRYSPRRSCPSLGLPKSRRALPAPRPTNLQHRGARFAAHATTPIDLDKRRVGGPLTVRRSILITNQQRAVSAARSSMRRLRLRTRWRRGGKPARAISASPARSESAGYSLAPRMSEAARAAEFGALRRTAPNAGQSGHRPDRSRMSERWLTARRHPTPTKTQAQEERAVASRSPPPHPNEDPGTKRASGGLPP